MCLLWTYCVHCTLCKLHLLFHLSYKFKTSLQMLLHFTSGNSTAGSRLVFTFRELNELHLVQHNLLQGLREEPCDSEEQHSVGRAVPVYPLLSIHYWDFLAEGH